MLIDVIEASHELGVRLINVEVVRFEHALESVVAQVQVKIILLVLSRNGIFMHIGTIVITSPDFLAFCFCFSDFLKSFAMVPILKC